MTFYKNTRIGKRNRKSYMVNVGKMYLTVVWMALALSSCVGALGEQGEGKDALLRLTFNPCGTRSRALSDGESTITDINVLVFNSAGALTGSAYATFAGGNYTMDVSARTGEGCSIYAIANTGSAAYFKGVATIADFKKKYVALASDPAELGNASKTVMFGKKTGVKIDAQTAITAADNFTLTRLCTKINFTIKPAAGITINGYQLCHVPMGSYITDETSTAYYNPPSAVFKDFDPVNVTTSAGTDVNGITYYIYENLAGKGTNPSAETRTATYAPTNATYLIVYATGPNWKSTYRIYLGGTGTTDYSGYDIPRNYYYPYTVKINGSGVNDVRVTCYPELINSSTGGTWSSGGSAMTTSTVKIGDYYFNDGSWGALADHVTSTVKPIGVIFSTRISNEEKNAGYTHGYALALQDANSTGCYWSTSGNDLSFLNDVTDLSAYYNDLSSGYVGTFANSLGTNSSYPAWYYAYQYKNTVAAPSYSSGWYLPTGGQWWDVMANLGKVDFGGFTNITNSETIQYESSTALSNINSYLTAASGGSAISSGAWYWSSSEVRDIGAVYVEFYNTYLYLCGAGNQYVKYGWGGIYGNYKIRSIIAF